MPKFNYQVGQVFVELSEPPRLVVPDDDNFREHNVRVLIREPLTSGSFLGLHFCVLCEGDDDVPPGSTMDEEFVCNTSEALDKHYGQSVACQEEASFTNCYRRSYGSAAEYIHDHIGFLLSIWEDEGYNNKPFFNYDGTKDLRGFLESFSPNDLRFIWLKSR